MEKLEFMPAGGEEPEAFYLYAQTTVGGESFILVSDKDEDAGGEFYIMRDSSAPEDDEALYELVEDEGELEALRVVFESLMEEADGEQ